MPITKRKPASVGEILLKEFIEPLGLTQGDLAQAMGVPRNGGQGKLAAEGKGYTDLEALTDRDWRSN